MSVSDKSKYKFKKNFRFICDFSFQFTITEHDKSTIFCPNFAKGKIEVLRNFRKQKLQEIALGECNFKYVGKGI